MGDIYSSSFSPKHFSLKGVYPNPFNAKTTILIQTYSETNPNFQIFDIKGNVLKEQKYSLEANKDYQIKLSFDTFSSGFYFLRVTGSRDAATTKMYLLK